MRQNPKLNLKHVDRDLHLMGLAHVAKNVGQTDRESETKRDGSKKFRQQKVPQTNK